MKTVASTNKQVIYSIKKIRRYLTTTALTATGLLAFSSPSHAQNWTDLQGGGFTTDISIPNTTNITQNLDIVKARGDLDITENHTVNIYQPGSTSLFAAYDIKDDPTRILGRLNANGQVLIIDQNGVFFGRNSVVNVGSIIATTGHISESDIDARKFNILNNGGSAVIDLQGTINVADAGLAGFVSPIVKNSGVINARLGKVAFAAGEKVTLDLYGDNLVNIAVDDKVGHALLENTGAINAEGGMVVVSAQAAKNVADNVINMDGVVDVSSVTLKGGKIILGGGTQGKVVVSGKLNASGAQGGDIKVTGEAVSLESTSTLRADANNTGNGGTVGIWGDSYAIMGGLASARGGNSGGNGGFIELSAQDAVGFAGNVDTSAAHGTTGTFLIDPTTIQLGNFSLFDGGTPANLKIDAQALANTLATSNVHLWATNTITTMAAIDLSTWNFFGFKGLTNNDLTLSAAAININHDITLGEGKLILRDALTSDSVFGFGLLTPPSDINLNTVNLSAKILAKDTVGGVASKNNLGAGQITGESDAVNVLSTNAFINQAIAFVRENGTVNLAGGTFNEAVVIGKALTLNGIKKNISGTDASRATGSGETIIKPNSPSIHITTGGVTVNGVTIDGGDNGILVDFAGAGTTTLVNNIIKNTTQNGILGQSWHGKLVADNNWIHDVAGHGISLNGNHPASEITNNKIDKAGADGIHLWNTSNGTKVATNTITKVTGNGITIDASQAVVATGNNINGTGGYGIAATDGVSGVSILSNNIDNTGKDGIYLANMKTIFGPMGAIVDGNKIGLNGPAFSIKGDGIYANQAEKLAVTNNQITNTKSTAHNKGNGVQVLNSASAAISGNTIWKTNWDGIRIQKSDNAVLNNNSINTVTRTGIYLDISKALNVYSNTIDNTGHDGINAQNNEGVTLTDNKIGLNGGADNIQRYGIQVYRGGNAILDANSIHNVKLDGIFVDGTISKGVATYAVEIKSNDINKIGANGIYVNGLRNQGGIVGAGRALIADNIVARTGVDGIHVKQAVGEILRNKVNFTGVTATGDAIELENANNSRVEANEIGLLGGKFNIRGDGVYVYGSSNAAILSNKITNTKSTEHNKGSGVYVNESADVRVEGNDIYKTDWDGIRVRKSDNGSFARNDIDNVIRTGIYLDISKNVTAQDNDIDFTGHDGINSQNNEGVTLIDNRIGLNGGVGSIKRYGIQMYRGSNAVVDGNSVYNAKLDGVFVNGTVKKGAAANAVEITNNDVNHSGQNGIDLNNVGDTLITGNTVNDSSAVGILVSGFKNGRIVVANNTVSLFNTGMSFESGVIDLTGASNTLTGGTTGLLFKPYALGGGAFAPLSLVDNDGAGSTPFSPGVDPSNYAGTLGAQIFALITGQYVELDNFAFWDSVNGVPLWIDARFGDYGGIRPQDFPGFALGTTDYQALEDKMFHYPDLTRNVGIFFFGPNPFTIAGLDIDVNQFIRSFPAFNGDATGLNIRITGLPSTGFGGGAGATGGNAAAALNNIAPFAGGQINPADLNNIETASGNPGSAADINPNDIEPAAGADESAPCWGDALNAAQNGQATNVVYSGNMDDALTDAAACGTVLL